MYAYWYHIIISKLRGRIKENKGRSEKLEWICDASLWSFRILTWIELRFLWFLYLSEQKEIHCLSHTSWFYRVKITYFLYRNLQCPQYENLREMSYMGHLSFTHNSWLNVHLEYCPECLLFYIIDKQICKDWRHGSVEKSTGCSCKGHEFCCQHTHGN